MQVQLNSVRSAEGIMWAASTVLTSLSRFVDGFISLDDMDESRGIDEDFGLLAHRGALTLNSDINGCHSSGGHCRDLRYQGDISVFRRRATICF